MSENGFRLYRRKDTPLLWAVFSVDGRTIRRSTGSKDRKTANRNAITKLQELENEVKRERANTLYEIGYLYINHRSRRLSKATVRSYNRCLESWLTFLGPVSTIDFDENTIKDYIDYRRSGGCTNGTIIQEVCFMTSAFKFADVKPNPFADFSFKRDIGKAEKRKTYITTDEYHRVLQLIKNPLHRDLFIMWVGTGMRKNEAANLRWSEVRSDFKFVTLPKERTKTRKGRKIALSNSIQSMLRTRFDTRLSEYVFASRNGKPLVDAAGWWVKLRLKHKLPPIRVHDLRHTFASWALQNGGSLRAVQDLLGHENIQQTAEYSHVNDELLITAVESVSESTN